jgi:hypothetical protein
VRNVTTSNPFLLRLGTKWPKYVPEDTGATWWTFQPTIDNLTFVQITQWRIANATAGLLASRQHAAAQQLEFDMPFGFH